MKRIAILASGTGTNAERIVRYFQEKGTAEVAWIIASRASAGVIERAARLHVPCKVITPDGFASGEAFRFLKENEIDFIVLAGPKDCEYPSVIAPQIRRKRNVWNARTRGSIGSRRDGKRHNHSIRQREIR